ncbi:hypothetical protein OSB04_001543 [Centaurea solstitialis]|uniref:Integrase catalytic domain-containing protein n=1 Tax=Centaurea solstitialis TaxID=347529 RepID=A0AA38WLI7_9ASTR|nr:hypothetical protein OSB04_001543 [Centaurea solstitialis]
MATSSDKFVQPMIPKFDGHYDHWSLLMENFLRSKEIRALVEEGVPIPTVGVAAATEAQKKAFEEAKLKDLRVKNFLFQAIDREILETILDKSSAKAIWDSMRQKYEGSTKVKRAQLQALRKEYELLTMKEREKVDAFMARTLTIVNKMKANGEALSQASVVAKVLRSLTPKFNYVVCSIEESNNLDTMTIDELHSSLLVQEQRLMGQVEEEQVLKVEDKRPNQWRSQRGRGDYRGRYRGRGRSRERSSFNKALCPDYEKKANYAEEEEDEEMVLMAYVDTKNAKWEHVWFFDSGCSNHMSGDKSWFCDLDEGFRHSVKLGNDIRMNVMGKGNVKLDINGMSHTLANVYYIPELKNNLLSVGQIQEGGIAILIKDNVCRLYHPVKGLIIESKMSTNRMFVLLATPTLKVPVCFNTNDDDTTHLWHCRYGHLNHNGLRTLKCRRMVDGLPELKTPKKQYPAHRLQLIHSDICGPVTPESCSKKKYIALFIDDYSRKCWTYYLAEKGQVFNTFKCFKACVEKETGSFIQCLRTDRGGEYNSTELRTTTHSSIFPQQNGVAERKNRTLLNMVRSILAERGVPKEYWAEAANWATYPLNRSPTLAVKNVTSEEAWSGTKPDVDHFRIFGCLAHVHVPKQKRKKLDDKSKGCVLFGVSEESKAYRLYDLETDQIIISRDVKFEEDEQWKWKKDEADQEVVEAAANDDADPDNSNLSGDSVVFDDSGDVIQSGAEGRTRRRPAWMRDYISGDELSDEEGDASQFVLFTQMTDPVTYDAASKDIKWREAMDQEMDAIERNKTWTLCELPEEAKAVALKWIFKTKLNEHGQVEKYKARLVAKGYSQEYGIVLIQLS